MGVPAVERDADEEDRQQGGPQAHERVEDSGAAEFVGVGRRGRGVDIGEGDLECAVEIGRVLRQERLHVVVEDCLAIGVGHERGLEPVAGIERHLAVDQVALHVEEDHEAVVEALAADAPLVEQGQRVVIGHRLAVDLLDLGVDGDLRPGANLDRLDRCLGRRDGPL